jgi:hypothetical protein
VGRVQVGRDEWTAEEARCSCSQGKGDGLQKSTRSRGGVRTWYSQAAQPGETGGKEGDAEADMRE